MILGLVADFTSKCCRGLWTDSFPISDFALYSPELIAVATMVRKEFGIEILGLYTELVGLSAVALLKQFSGLRSWVLGVVLLNLNLLRTS